ncbi:MAG: cupin domain-containing protein [Chloroflexi bacterium]|nr:cupin domain-containing protein [Chloroflexota bacterium]
MLIRNAFTTPRRIGQSGHGGDGTIENARVFDQQDLVSDMFVIAIDVIPPGASIAVHDHPAEEEVYFILEGRGIITITGEEREVGPGDMGIVQPGGSHGIRNTGTETLRMIAFGASCRDAEGKLLPTTHH